MNELTESQKIQQEYTVVCSKIGELYFHESMIQKDLATLRAKQIELSDQHRLAIEKEKKEQQEQQTKEHFAEKAVN